MDFVEAGPRVAETSPTTGTGALVLAGAYSSSHQRFRDVCTVGDTIPYWALDDAGAWETGIGTYSAADTLARTTRLASSTGAAINFTANKTVFLGWTGLGNTVHAAVEKTTLADDDEGGLWDSITSKLRKFKLSTLVSYLRGFFLHPLTTDLTLYVRTDGNDANDGSANDAAHAFATPQAAFDHYRSTYAPSKHFLTIKLGNSGTFEALDALGPYYVYVEGDTVTPANTVIKRILSESGCYVGAGPCKVEDAASEWLLQAQYGGSIEIFGGTILGDCTVGQITAWYGGIVYLYENYEIAGASCQYHASAYASGTIESGGVTVTISGSNTFGVGFLEADTNGAVFDGGDNVYTVTGTLTGKRFSVETGAAISILGPDPNFDYYPGSLPGYLGGGGVYNGVTGQYLYTVSQLPTPSASIDGAQMYVIDATATTFASVVAGGGANKVPVYCDGADWRIG